MELLQKIPAPSPMYMQPEKDRLWVLLRQPFEESGESGVIAYDVHSGQPCTELFSTQGIVACHLAVSENEVYCANYLSGSILKLPDQLVVHTGHGMDPIRQAAPHPHAVFFSPDKKELLCCDLGLDAIFVYDRHLNLLSVAKVPDGAGPRHLVFSKDGNFVYCINEMGGSISVFSYQKRTLQYIKTLSLLPTGRQGAGAAIKLSAAGDRLYVTERATQKIMTLAVNGADLALLAGTDCHGREPRDFSLLAADRFALCANQFSDNIALFRMDEQGIPEFLNEFPLPAPLCIVTLQ